MTNSYKDALRAHAKALEEYNNLLGRSAAGDKTVTEAHLLAASRKCRETQKAMDAAKNESGDDE